jgi:hypothetical protein
MRTTRYIASLAFFACVALLGWNSGCGGSNANTPDGGGGEAGGSGSGSGDFGGGLGTYDGNVTGSGSHICSKDGNVCTNLCSGGTTIIKGKVFDPAGNNPVYNAAVWVPYSTPGPMPPGLTCNCSELYTGGFVGAYDLTKPDGSFTITGAPSAKTGGSVPIVVQVAKWRYQTSIGVTCGTTTNVPDKTLRLPQGRPGTGVMFPGDLPSLAISTGGADTLECLLTRVGVDKQEYVAGPGTPTGGHVHIYQGNPASAPNTMPPAPQSSAALWDTPAHLSQFDAVLLSCEGAPTMATNPGNLLSYGQAGGRVFASHFHYQWFLGQPFPNFGTWDTAHANNLATTYGVIQTTLPNGSPFYEGKALLAFLQATNSLDANNELVILQARHNIDVPLVTPQTAVPWINFDTAKSTFFANTTNDPLVTSPTLNSTLYFSWDTQAPGTETTCGRFVYSDLHVGGNSGDYGESAMASSPPAGGIVPTGCNAGVPLSNQEKALEFMLFDLTSCLAPPGGGADAGTGVPQ